MDDRSYIWINVNYLAVRALDHYAKLPGPYQPRAQRIYTELRENLLTTVLGEYVQCPAPPRLACHLTRPEGALPCACESQRRYGQLPAHASWLGRFSTGVLSWFLFVLGTNVRGSFGSSTTTRRGGGGAATPSRAGRRSS